MPDPKRPRSQRLEKTIGMLQSRYGARAVQAASALPRRAVPPHVATGFSRLDAITGCNGVPVGAITLFTGPTTSGKLTLAYKVLANAQNASPLQRRRGVAILDLTYSADPDYLARCGADLEYLLFARAPSPLHAVDAVFDLARNGIRLLLVDGLADLLRDRAAARYFDAALPQLGLMLKTLPCAVIFLDEARPPWLRWLKLDSSAIAHVAALHVELKREIWLERDRELVGYRAQAQVIKSRWARAGQTVPVEIIFNGTVRARETW
jgi:recombination protein RecA